MKSLTKQQMQKVDTFFKRKSGITRHPASKNDNVHSLSNYDGKDFRRSKQTKPQPSLLRKSKGNENSNWNNSRKSISAHLRRNIRSSKSYKGLERIKEKSAQCICKISQKQLANTFKITTESLLDTAKVNQALTFFKSNHISAKKPENW